MASIHAMAGKFLENGHVVRRDMWNRYYFSKDTLGPIKNGTSGHRGLTGTGFTDKHVAALTQAVVDIRKERGSFGPDGFKLTRIGGSTDPRSIGLALGPIVIGKDVRFTSDFALKTTVEVLAGNRMKVIISSDEKATPTPVISHKIIKMNRAGENVEGIIITASHNPPEEAGYKTNGMDGGPNTRTKEIDGKANEYLKDDSNIKRIPYEMAVKHGLVQEVDLIRPYVEDLNSVVNMELIRSGKFGVSPLGGSACGVYELINQIHGTDIRVIYGEPDPSGINRTSDWDGKLRGDPSSTYVMQAVFDKFPGLNVPFIGANDNDADRFGGVDSTGILNPNHILCVLFDYLARERGWDQSMGIGRTIGTTHMLDRIAANYDRPVYEVNVGFKYYVDGIKNGKYVLAGEESAGLCIPRFDGKTWVTEKDGIVANLLMMEVIAKTGKDVGTLYGELESKYGIHQYQRIDAPATPEKKAKLAELCNDPSHVESLLSGKQIAGRNIERIKTGDGIKVVLEGGVWVLKRASGTENIIKDYREERSSDRNMKTAERASVEIDHLLELK